jgi:pyruvate formate lyase activating enzyme
MTAADVLAVVRRDVPFYAHSGGGMTLSGGEPLLQWDFSRALLTLAHAEGMHTAMETSAAAPWERLATLLPLVDLFYVDVKHTDDLRHCELTGISNALIVANIRQLAAEGHRLIVRVPWVPVCNVDEGFLHGLTALLLSCATPPPVEFLPYHRLGQSKWLSLGSASPMSADIPDARAEEVTPWLEHLHARGITATINA